MLMPAVWSGRDRRPDKPRTLNATIPSCKDRIFPHKRVHRKTEFWYKCLNSPHKYVLSTYYMISIRGVQKQSKTRTKASDSIPPPHPPPAGAPAVSLPVLRPFGTPHSARYTTPVLFLHKGLARQFSEST